MDPAPLKARTRLPVRPATDRRHRVRRERPVESRPRIWPPVLDWSDSKHWGAEEPCVLCRKPTQLRSDKGEACHKVCAEAWYEARPEAWARYLSGDAG